MAEASSGAAQIGFSPAAGVFYEEVEQGLRSSPRTLPCKYFYDAQGSQLFDAICELPEYYVTRTELEIMRRHAGEMAERIGPGVMLIEYGSGSSVKTRLLLSQLDRPAAYVPVDISGDHLLSTSERLRVSYPQIEILPVCADFTESFALPRPSTRPTHNAVYFPGSTIGNFHPAAASRMLRTIVELCGCGGGLLIGVDLQKDPAVLMRAYDDSQGVTAAFNQNLLRRINRELDANFELDAFEHQSYYDTESHRIEMRLVSRCDQAVTIGGEEFGFDRGESIRTECSYKHTVEGFAQLASEAGLALRESWTDDDERFAVLHLVVAD
ncbi:Histidine-specific methyltransferase EgtD [Pseudobythopirellula maris]|uniref:Histidine-specific methyltransferase EgtD n=1 Tax=Pseudobythopirellula maris TaxID=2527991 RepID=A0A5C5ZSJ4_9BACT|nr:L-histidine N(alpha)-methyltransferase [Pseudobythopirellula maris]TWT90479.1 Histidine-specific methyltransferase EgtD [Pseudobythopirellula maris]